MTNLELRFNNHWLADRPGRTAATAIVSLCTSRPITTDRLKFEFDVDSDAKVTLCCMWTILRWVVTLIKLWNTAWSEKGQNIPSHFCDNHRLHCRSKFSQIDK
ncbi:MAG: hypothetical protein OXC80_01355 [Gammaproteobacteria bacterium]|nr:hypothetical protein [Gammaproteobacteria bacterium]